MLFFRKYLLLFLFGIITYGSFSQTVQLDSNQVVTDSNAKKKLLNFDFSSKNHSPTRATLFSAVLPGLGKIYNKKYWKIPIVYAAFGASIYFIDLNNKGYQRYLQAHRDYEQDPTSLNNFNGANSIEELIFYKDYYHKYRDMSYVITVAIYLLNIIDSNVDAHLYYFDVSEDLSLHIEPCLISTQNRPTAAIKISFKF